MYVRMYSIVDFFSKISIDPGLPRAQQVKDALWLIYQNVDDLAQAFDAQAQINATALTVNHLADRFAGVVTGNFAGGIKSWFSGGPFFEPGGIEHYDATPAFVLNIDPTWLDRQWFVRSNGTIDRISLERAIAHELYHALIGTTDPLFTMLSQSAARAWLGDPESDWVGDTVARENALPIAINQGWFRVGYNNGLPDGFTALSSNSLTDSHVVSFIYVDGSVLETALYRGTLLDLHHRAGDHLILGLDGVDKIIGSHGNDFLYGGIGDDFFVNNYGDDFFHGGDLWRPQGADGTDTVDYQRWDDFFTASDQSITVTLGDSGANSFGSDGSHQVIFVDDGHGGTDRLVSIEKIIGTDNADTIRIVSLQGAEVADLTINLGGGVDTLDLSGAERSVGGYNVNLFDLGDQYASLGNGPALHLRNVDNVVGSTGNDNVVLPHPGQGSIATGGDPYALT